MNIEDLMDQLVLHEGLVLTPYYCPAGKLTIGVGRNLEDRGITHQEAMYLLRNDVSLYMQELIKSFPIAARLDEVRLMTLVNMAFNLGITRLKGFKNMWSAIEDGDFEKAALEMMDSKWALDVGKRAIVLSEQMRTGVFRSNL
jgi:lysozyme